MTGQFDSFDLGPCCEETEDDRHFAHTVYVDARKVTLAAHALSVHLAREHDVLLPTYTASEVINAWLDGQLESLLENAQTGLNYPHDAALRDLCERAERRAVLATTPAVNEAEVF